MKVGLGSSTMADEPPSTSLPSASVARSFSTCSCCLSPSPFDAKERRKKRRDFGERQQVVKWDTRNILESTARSWIAGNFFFHLGDINPDSDLLPSQRRKLHPPGKEEESEPTRGESFFCRRWRNWAIEELSKSCVEFYRRHLVRHTVHVALIYGQRRSEGRGRGREIVIREIVKTAFEIALALCPFCSTFFSLESQRVRPCCCSMNANSPLFPFLLCLGTELVLRTIFAVGTWSNKVLWQRIFRKFWNLVRCFMANVEFVFIYVASNQKFLRNPTNPPRRFLLFLHQERLTIHLYDAKTNLTKNWSKEYISRWTRYTNDTLRANRATHGLSVTIASKFYSLAPYLSSFIFAWCLWWRQER